MKNFRIHVLSNPYVTIICWESQESCAMQIICVV